MDSDVLETLGGVQDIAGGLKWTADELAQIVGEEVTLSLEKLLDPA